MDIARLKPLLALFLWLFVSCQADNNSYPWTIKDFRSSLQPHLTALVSKGIVGYEGESLDSLTTDEELMQLIKSEHPVLRASAFREMLERKSFNQFEILMNHLNDTAVVATDVGEWGIWYKTVTDDIIENAEWNSIEEKNKTINEVIMHHNYLRSAYTILYDLQPQERYYHLIKEMATRERKSIGQYQVPYMSDLEFALYGLAKFKKKEDIKVIKDLLLTTGGTMDGLSFRIMREFPDTAYLEVFEDYYPGGFYRSIYRDRGVDKAEEFIRSIAIYKNNRSATILESILNRKYPIACFADTSLLRYTLHHAIWDNKCNAYSKMIKQIEKKIQEDKKDILLPPMAVTIPERPIKWWPR